MKDNIIIINAFPSNDNKIKMLERQISYLKKLNIPILLVSGCHVPDNIVSEVDYILINKDNEIIGKDFYYKLYNNGIFDFPYDFIQFDNTTIRYYWSNVNSTITKNIKLGFNLAKSLGYKSAFYTEDDNIWKYGSFDYIHENLTALKKGYKLSVVIGDLFKKEYPIIFTTFMFADVEYMCQNFTIPSEKEDWYDLNNIRNYKLNLAYEAVVFNLFKNKLNLINNTEESFSRLTKDGGELMEWSINDRRHSEKNLIDTFFTVMPTNINDDKNLVLHNQSHYLKSGGKNYNIKIYYDDVLFDTINLGLHTYNIRPVIGDVKEVKLIIDGYGEKLIKCDHTINHNGIYFYA
jgi:hypothetical protein